jgi:hypothetical protein
VEIASILYFAFLDEVKNHPISFVAWLVAFVSVIVRNYKIKKALALISLGLITIVVVLVLSGKATWYYEVRLVNYFILINAFVYGAFRFLLALVKMAITWRLVDDNAPFFCLLVCAYSIVTQNTLVPDISLVNWEIAKFCIGGWALMILIHFSRTFLNKQ